jgi:uncharacterized membrane protein YkvI
MELSMKRKKRAKNLFIILGILVPVVVIVVLVILDSARVWDTWGLQEDGSIIYPGWDYLLLLLFKFSLYIFPSAIISVGLTIENLKQVQKKKYIYYFLSTLNVWFLVLLTIKLMSDSIFELDRIFGLTIFNSIKDVQTLIGFILTVILKRTIKIEPNEIYEAKPA